MNWYFSYTSASERNGGQGGPSARCYGPAGLPKMRVGQRTGSECAGKAGEVLWMRVPYGEGLANHTGPESCGGDRKVVVEALTGVRAGWVSSLEIFNVRSADGLRPSEGNTGRVAIARPVRAPRGLRPHARTQAPHSGGGVLPRQGQVIGDGSREIPGSARAVARARAVNPKGERRR